MPAISTPPARGATNVNERRSYGGRASLLFTPDRRASRSGCSALAQNIETELALDLRRRSDDAASGRSDHRRLASEASRTRYERIARVQRLDYRLYTGTIDYDFGFANLTSITSYSEQDRDELGDASTTERSGASAKPSVRTDRARHDRPRPSTNDVSVEKFTQEVRLQSPDGDRFEWLVGGYYTDEERR